jgi:hypothetical protein
MQGNDRLERGLRRQHGRQDAGNNSNALRGLSKVVSEHFVAPRKIATFTA